MTTDEPKPIECLDSRIVLRTHPFQVEEMTMALGGKALERPYHRLRCPDWVNVLPITADRRAVLIRQPRAGVLRLVLETPGGVMEPGEKDPTLTVARELEEETGFSSQRILSLGSLAPNPAINNNRCHFFLALGCMPVVERQHFPDPDERLELVPVPVADLDGMVRTGQIDHALSATCILLALKYLA
jgi:ADP-ribose pyrophosphatase